MLARHTLFLSLLLGLLLAAAPAGEPAAMPVSTAKSDAATEGPIADGKTTADSAPEADQNRLQTIITGEVVNEQGQGIPNARVIVWNWPYARLVFGSELMKDWRDLVLGETKTDGEGRYELTIRATHRQATRPVQAAFVAEGYAVHEEPWSWGTPLPPVIRRPVVTLTKGQVLVGRIVDENGQPVSGATVTSEANVCPHNLVIPYFDGGSVLTTTTDNDGAFFLEGANSVKQALRIERRDCLGAYRGTLASAQKGEIRVPAAAILQGRVILDATGEPVAGAEVACVVVLEERLKKLDPAAQRWLLTLVATADREGRFRMRTCSLGGLQYRVVARAKGLCGVVEDLRVGNEEAADCEVRMLPAFDLSGKLVFRETGTGVPQIRLAARLGDEAVLTESDETGAFSFHGLVLGQYEVCLFSPVFGCSYRTKAELRPDGTQDDLVIEFLGSGLDTRLAGTVRDAGGHPVPGAWVTSDDTLRVMTTTDEDGRYELRLLVPKRPRALRLDVRDSRTMMQGHDEIGPDWTTGEKLDVTLNIPYRESRPGESSPPKW